MLTREFREQNQNQVWKEDVLQLRAMMWFAWLSCRKQLQKMDEEGQGQDIPSAISSTVAKNVDVNQTQAIETGAESKQEDVDHTLTLASDNLNSRLLPPL